MNPHFKFNETSKTPTSEFPSPDEIDSKSEFLLKSLKNSLFLDSIENFHMSRNGSNFSDIRLSFTTDEVVPSQRTSIVSDDQTEVNFYQFKFEQKIQSKLKTLSFQVKNCKWCKSTSYFLDKLVLQDLSFLQLISYWLESFRCCSDPKVLGKYLVKKSFCIYCGRAEE
jgi:hypothetical protein